VKSARRRAREFVLQALYQWQLGGQTLEAIEPDFRDAEGFAQADQTYFTDVLHGVVSSAAELEAVLVPCLDRPLRELSPVERGILLLSTYELSRRADIPYKVVINEAVELAKTFGGTDGHKYVNGVLDQVAAKLRK
jgi:N utilization substance protein B